MYKIMLEQQTKSGSQTIFDFMDARSQRPFISHPFSKIRDV